MINTQIDVNIAQFLIGILLLKLLAYVDSLCLNADCTCFIIGSLVHVWMLLRGALRQDCFNTHKTKHRSSTGL